MPATMLDGNFYASQIKAEVADEVQQLAASGIRPGLAAILVGDSPASQTYVRSKVRTCEQLGIFSELITPPESSTTEELVALVEQLNARDEIDGILNDVALVLERRLDVDCRIRDEKRTRISRDIEREYVGDATGGTQAAIFVDDGVQ